MKKILLLGTYPQGVILSRANVNGGVQTTTFNPPPFFLHDSTTLVSPNLHSTAIITWGRGVSHLHFYDMPTGQCLGSVPTKFTSHHSWFTLDGCEVWCVTLSETDIWKITKNNNSGIAKLEYLE